MVEIEKLNITDDMSELEKFVRQEAMNYVNSTIFLSCISDHHKNIDNVVEKGKDVTPYVVKLYKEKGEYATDNMFTHFFLIVMSRLYGNPFGGYVGMEMCVRYWLKAYEHDCLDFVNKKCDNTEKAINFLSDLFNISKEDVEKQLEEQLEIEIQKQLETEDERPEERMESVQSL